MSIRSKNLSRYVLPLVLIIGLLWVFSVNAAPTVSSELCITLQGARNAGNDEPVDWELRQAGTVEFSGSTDAIIQGTASLTACFQATGVPGDSYDLYIKGEDHLGVLHTLAAPWPNAGTSTDLTADVELLDGDADNDNAITSADFSILVSQMQFPALCDGAAGYDARADFNEDGCVNSADFSILVTDLQFPSKTGDS